ncbi:MAG: thiol:disulfide interchange protein DsbA/DsbL [Propionivibrio sp.]
MKKLFAGRLAVYLFALVSLLALALPARAQLVAGPDFVEINPPLAVDNPARIEVVEFFSYACPHCNDLNPTVKKWAAKLPSDVEFKRVAVSFNSPFYQLMARLYYTLDALGELERLDAAVFDAIHVKGLKLIDEKSIQEWAVGQGIDAKKFSDAFKSFSVDSNIKRADTLSRAAKIPGVPTLVVNGRYRVVGQNVKSHDELLALTDKVIDKARAERAAKK